MRRTPPHFGRIVTVGAILRFAATLLPGLLPARAAVYDLALPDDGNRSLRLHVPAAPATLRGVLIHGNGANSDARAMAADPELVAFAGSLGFALLATAQWGYFADGTATGGELARFESALQTLATSSGHPELTRVPWLPIGHSNGGQISYGFNALRPAKTIALVVSKGGFYTTARPDAAALATPGLLVAGEADLDYRRTAIRDLFLGNRPRGALWAWVEDQGIDHALASSNDLTLPFVEAMAWARLPPRANATDGSASLRALDESAGWLTEPDSYKTGYASVASFATYPGTRSLAGWLPDRRLALLFRAFASYDKSGTATLAPGAGPVAWGENVTYTVAGLPADWRTIEFYDGELLLARRSPADANPLSLTATPRAPGYTVLHAVVTLADGSQRTTPPRRVFVSAPAPALTATQPAPASSVAAGTPITLAVTAVDPHLTFAWFRDGAPLPDWSGPSATFIAGAADAGRYTVTATDVLGRTATADLGSLAVRSDARLMNLSARAAVGTGDDVLIAGFVTTADAPSAQKTILVRGIGPELARSAGLAGALPAAGVKLFDVAGTRLASANDWAPALAAVFTRVGAFPLAAGSRDAALARDLAAGLYSAHLAGADGGTGIGIAEIYDADESTPVCRLVNLSARAHIGAGDAVLIGGLVIAGTTAETVLIRGVGPTLAQPPYSLQGALTATEFELFDDQGRSIARQRGWTVAAARGPSPAQAGVARAGAALMARLGAFALTAGDSDSAAVFTLPPGLYSVHVRGVADAAGLGMVEIYEVR